MQNGTGRREMQVQCELPVKIDAHLKSRYAQVNRLVIFDKLV